MHTVKDKRGMTMINRVQSACENMWRTFNQREINAKEDSFSGVVGWTKDQGGLLTHAGCKVDRVKR